MDYRALGQLKGSLVTKITLILMAVIVPLFFLCILINTYGTDLISSIIINNTKTVSEESLDRLENNISRMFTYESRLILDAALVSDMQSSNLFSKYTKLNELIETQKKFDVVYQSSDFMKDLRMHLPSAQKTVGFYRGISELDQEEFRYFTNRINATPQKRSGIFTKDNQLYIVTVNDSYSTLYSNTPNAMCVIELLSKPLLQSLRIFSDESMMGNYILSAQGGDFQAENVRDEAISKQITALAQAEGSNHFTADIDGEKFLVMKNSSAKFGLTLTCYIPHSTLFRDLSGFSAILYLFAGLLIIAFGVIMVLLYRTICRPVRKMTEAFRRLEQGAFGITLIRRQKDEFGYAFSSFNHMSEKLDKLIKEEYQHTIAMQKANLKQLQAQINPHFLYNSFYILKHRIKSYDNENAAQFADYLGDYFRFITKEQADFVPLCEEYEHALTYLNIQLIRFRDKVQFTCDPIPQGFQKTQVPRLILQPIVENAFVHGFDRSEAGGKIHIGMELLENACLCITVENTAGNMQEDVFLNLKKELEEGVRVDDNISGLSNISLRLKELYGPEFGLMVRLAGNMFSVQMILKHGERMEEQHV